jgi:hypothetical protein
VSLDAQSGLADTDRCALPREAIDAWALVPGVQEDAQRGPLHASAEAVASTSGRAQRGVPRERLDLAAGELGLEAELEAASRARP